MKVSELRVENLVWACGDAAKIVTIDEGFCKVQFLVDIEFRPVISIIDLGDIEPIPLTEEWLKKFGFIWQGGDHWANEINDTWVEDKGGLYRIARPVCTKFNLKYVHQLQNLYFSLTGNELKIK